MEMVEYMVGRVPYVDRQQLEGRSFTLPHTNKQLCHTDHSCVICTVPLMKPDADAAYLARFLFFLLKKKRG